MRKIAKQKTVILVTPTGERKEFGIQHAERLLDLGTELNGGWQIASDSEYIYDEENGIRVKTDKGNFAETK